jgi:hypothetical protein
MTALSQYINLINELSEKLDRLKNACDNHFNTNPDNITYADLSEISNIDYKIKLICDQVFKEGEYK